jgi:plasmid stabilization system protein ParE
MVSNRLPFLLDARAEADLDEAAQWYADQRQELAIDFLNNVDAVFSLIMQFPRLGLEVAPGIRRVLTKRFPFCVYYAIDDGGIVVFAILHLRRNSDVWLRRVK